MAVSLVLVYHFFPDSAPGGFIGVDLFFVLSGFLITTLLLQEWTANGSVSLGRFCARRALRLLPALWVALAAFLIVGLTVYDSADRHSVILFVSASAFDFANFAVLAGLPIYHVFTWSLSAEEQFYLLWLALLALGLAAVAAKRIRPRTLVCVLLTAIAASVVVRAALWDEHHDWLQLYYNPLVHSDGLMLGCALALARSWGLLDVGAARTRVVGVVGIFALLVFTLTLKTDEGLLHTYGYPLVVIAASAAVYAAAVPFRAHFDYWQADRLSPSGKSRTRCHLERAAARFLPWFCR